MFDIGASTLWKAGGILLAVIVMASVAFYKGMAFTQTRWDAAVAEQQMRTGEFIMKQTYNNVRSEQANQKTIQRREKEKGILAQKVRDYEAGTSQKCELSPEFESVADSLIRVREPAADSVPAAADPPSVPDAKDQPRLADTTILRFIESAVSQLNACADTHNALVDWENSSRAIAMEGAGRTE